MAQKKTNPSELEVILANLKRSHVALSDENYDSENNDSFTRKNHDKYLSKYEELLTKAIDEKKSLKEVYLHKDDEKYHFVDNLKKHNKKYPFIIKELPHVSVKKEIRENDQINYILEYHFIVPDKNKNLFVKYVTTDSIKLDHDHNYDEKKLNEIFMNSAKKFIDLYSKKK
jgi:hypothetical protein